jgi:hypothetical protein
MAIEVSSPAFGNGEAIPRKFTGEGADVSPALQWSGVPAGAASIALICDDPDAPIAEPFVHWVIFNLPADTKGLPEGVPANPTVDAPSAMQGENFFGNVGYGGPMPPEGHGTHHYHFKIYALDARLDLEPGAGKPEVLAAMEGHILDEGELVGTYER